MADLIQLKQAHKVLAEFRYDRPKIDKGYANHTLHIDLTNNSIESQPVTDEMKEAFTGGKGFGLWLLWNAVNDDTRWDDPENALTIAGGPIGGITAYPGSGKSTVVTISPLTHSIIDSNVGGYFGPFLKFSGWDALSITGIAKKDVILVIDGDSGKITIEEAPLEQLNTHILARQLTEMYAESDSKRDMQNVSVVSAGDAADHINYAILNFSWYDPRREEVRVKQAGRGGTGRVFRHKHIKALVIKFSDLKGDSNNPVDMDLIRKAGKRMNQEIFENDPKQNNMRKIGTGHLPPIMNHFDLFPVHNFRYGKHKKADVYDTETWMDTFTQDIPDGCWYGCTMACAHGVDHFHLQTGPYKDHSVLVDGPEYETIAGVGSNIGVFDTMAVVELNFYCDTYGVDTISFGNCIAFCMECYEVGILDKEKTGGLELTWGNALAALEILHQMARGEGFGLIVGKGVRFMKEYFAEEFGGDPGFLQDIGMEVKGLEISEYVTKESLAQQGGYGLAVKGGQHDEAWLIFMDMVYNQLPTFEAKAEALHYFPMWRTWFSLHGLCKLPWNDVVPDDNKDTKDPNKVEKHVENYTWIYEGLSGKKTTPEDLLRQSEKVYNFQRVFTKRLGFGTREHDYLPYRAMGPVTAIEYESRQERYDKQLAEEAGVDPSQLDTEQKMAELRRYREQRYEDLMDAVYKRRGWNGNGVPTVEKLKSLGIDFPDVVKTVTS